MKKVLRYRIPRKLRPDFCVRFVRTFVSLVTQKLFLNREEFSNLTTIRIIPILRIVIVDRINVWYNKKD